MKGKLSDNWVTPDWLFKELDAEFNFDIDLCATEENSKCLKYCLNYLEDKVLVKGMELGTYLYFHTKYGNLKTAFMNPPYSNPKPFIQKAWEDSKHFKIVCLVKCDPSTQWWATFWEYEMKKKVIMIPESDFGIGYERKEILIKPGPKPGCEVRFFPKRIKFVAPEGLNGSSGPTFPCALVIMDRGNV